MKLFFILWVIKLYGKLKMFDLDSTGISQFIYFYSKWLLLCHKLLNPPPQSAPPLDFSKTSFLGRGWNPAFFLTFNITISYIFPENFIEISQVTQKIWRFFSFNIDFSDFLTFPYWRKTNDVSIYELMSAFF